MRPVSSLIAFIPSPAENGFHVGPLFFRAYGICYIFAVLGAVVVTSRRWEKLGGDGALSGLVGKVHGSAAKNGLAGMTRALALEVAEHGIRVNCVSPGSIDTSRAAHRPPRKSAAGRIPLGRHGHPEEIAAAVRFLCGPGATFITGQTIHVNGGEKLHF